MVFGGFSSPRQTPPVPGAPAPTGLPGLPEATTPVFPPSGAPAVAPSATAPSAVPPLPPLPALERRGRTVSLWLFGVLGFGLIVLAAYFLDALGPTASLIGLLLALLPLGVVLVGVRMVDRWEPEPLRIKVFAIAWGAFAATGLTLLLGLGISWVVGPVPDLVGSVINAPIIEEAWKGLGIFLVFLMARRSFDGPVDGVVYGALVGAGFAFTENVQYFAVSLIEGGGAELTMTFLLRAVLSPFAHAMFTALTGLAMGFAARRDGSAGAVLRTGLLGYAGAVGLHAFWNGSALLTDFFGLYVTLQVPLFAGFILGAVLLQREEAGFTRRRLADYVPAGWLTPQEVTMLATPAGRRTGLAWASTLRGDRRPLMRAFIADAVALAHVRQRVLLGRDGQARHDEQVLLMRMVGHRAALLAY